MYPDARNPFAHRELLDAEELEPWTVPQLWLMGRDDADVFVDTTDTIDKKVAALLVAREPDEGPRRRSTR